MQVGTSVGAPSHGERVGVFAVAVGLTGGEKLPVSAVVAVVKRGRSGITSGVKVSVTVSSKWNFSIFSNE